MLYARKCSCIIVLSFEVQYFAVNAFEQEVSPSVTGCEHAQTLDVALEKRTQSNFDLRSKEIGACAVLLTTNFKDPFTRQK